MGPRATTATSATPRRPTIARWPTPTPRRCCEQVRTGDVVLLHDPQTAGMAAALEEAGAHVVWRCHIGSDAPERVDRGGVAFSPLRT